MRVPRFYRQRSFDVATTALCLVLIGAAACSGDSGPDGDGDRLTECPDISPRGGEACAPGLSCLYANECPGSEWDCVGGAMIQTGFLDNCTPDDVWDAGDTGDASGPDVDPSDATAVDGGQPDAVDAASVGTAAEQQLTWFLHLLNTGTTGVSESEIEEHFTEDFLAEVSAEDLLDITADLHRDLAPVSLLAVESMRDFALEALIAARTGDRLVVSLSTEPVAPHRMTGLLIQPAPEIDPEAVPTSWDEVGERAAAVSEAAVFLAAEVTDDGDCAKISALGPDERLALGSAFKLYVLATLADTIASGEMAWDDLLAIEEAWKSLPSGQMHLEAAGTEFALVEYAELMISISDNTATDHLIRHLERERVEQTLELAGHMAPEVNTPFITTREMFLLKGALGAGDRDDYLALDPDGRRRFLDEELASMSLDAVRAWPEPRNVDTIEWFASPEELCAAMVVLRGLGDATDTAEVNEVLSANPGVDFGAVDWPFIGFKGGSEPGVLNLTWLLRRDDGRWFFLSFGFVDTMDAFAIEEPLHLAIGAAQLLADH